MTPPRVGGFWKLRKVTREDCAEAISSTGLPAILLRGGSGRRTKRKGPATRKVNEKRAKEVN